MSYNSSIVKGTHGKTVGFIQDRVFSKEVYGSKHMLRKPMAWAIDADIFDRVISPNCYSIQVIDLETRAKYIVGVNAFKNKCQTLDRKWGKQYYLELVHWQVRGVK